MVFCWVIKYGLLFALIVSGKIILDFRPRFAIEGRLKKILHLALTTMFKQNSNFEARQKV